MELRTCRGPDDREDTGVATAVTDVRIFDGETVLDATTVVLEGTRIIAVGTGLPADADVVDGHGGTLLPGLIDAHTHTSDSAPALALRFGVTTELEMQGTFTREGRAHVIDDDSLVDVRSAGFGLTPPGGHPSELFPADARPGADGEPIDDTVGDPVHGPFIPFVTSPAQATAAIAPLVASGSDYVKFMIDDGTVEGHPGLPMLDRATLQAGVDEAHRLGMLTVAHTLTADATRMAVDAGIDGLAHVFMDVPHDDAIIELIARSGVFVVPCVVLDASMMGITGTDLADDPRVGPRLDDAWLATLRSSFGHYPQGRIEDVLATVSALHVAGVDLLTGTDASFPVPFLGGLAHGASVHHELQYLVRAGLTPLQALRTATSVPARRFDLDDRGLISPGRRADLLLVDGDPTTTVTDTLNLRSVWRRGTRLPLA